MTTEPAIDVHLDPDAVRQAAQRWWLLAVIGVITAVLGVAVIVRPIAGVFALAVLIAAGFIISGLGDLVTAQRWPRTWVPITWGVLSLAAGLITLLWPGITLTVLAVVVGLVLVVRGVVAVVASVSDRPYGWAVWVVIGAVEVLVGIAAVVWPDITIVVIAIVIGINLLITGLLELVVALRLRTLQ